MNDLTRKSTHPLIFDEKIKQEWVINNNVPTKICHFHHIAEHSNSEKETDDFTSEEEIEDSTFEKQKDLTSEEQEVQVVDAVSDEK